ncbi:uncharacterized protein LOC132904158 [Amyelois transitella]|uniref:uncharacterized protein LOC132904158 n=1 Tax=Amyelois transitella TaxID=680683 RepID=UPI0029904556|nr:uncharacterized protein LOC132904158 [Amyelois transitella]
MSICRKCKKQIKATDVKGCSKCAATYHYQCLDISPENFAKESKAYKCSWKCTECKSIDRRGDISDTLSPSATSSHAGDSSDISNIADLKSYFDRSLEEALSRQRKDIIRDFAADSADTRAKLQELTTSIQYMSDRYDQLQEALEQKSKDCEELRSENKELRSDLGILQAQVEDLGSKLNQFEQLSRDNNLEIQCVPEHSAENLKSVINQLAGTVGHPLREHEILNYHRVAKINKDTKRPKSIIVKLSSPLIRDSLLAAVKTFNRTHQSDKLNSAHLGLADKDKQPIYVCEHLTPTNKQLHAAARKAAKDKNFQFVWVRNGRVFMRKDPASKSFVVKD